MSCFAKIDQWCWDLGLEKYEDLFPAALAFDLNQDPLCRPRKSECDLHTLTTGSTKIWLPPKKRFLSGLECLALHSIAVSPGLAATMGCTEVQVGALSHSAQCFLAGNCMHTASVGSVIALCLFCIAKDS